MSDAIAIGAIRGLRDRGLSIPADISVVGFDDIELAETTDPPLTTVHQPIRGKGEEAARLLLSVLAGREEPAGHRRLATRLIVRASTASVPRAAREVTEADRRSTRDAARGRSVAGRRAPDPPSSGRPDGRPRRPPTNTMEERSEP